MMSSITSRPTLHFSKMPGGNSPDLPGPLRAQAPASTDADPGSLAGKNTPAIQLDPQVAVSLGDSFYSFLLQHALKEQMTVISVESIANAGERTAAMPQQMIISDIRGVGHVLEQTARSDAPILIIDTTEAIAGELASVVGASPRIRNILAIDATPPHERARTPEEMIQLLKLSIEHTLARQPHVEPSTLLFSALQEALSGVSAPNIEGQSGLTPRELQVAQLIARGRMTNDEVATQLGVSIYTVKNHVHNVIEKMAIKGRHEIAEGLRQRGIR